MTLVLLCTSTERQAWSEALAAYSATAKYVRELLERRSSQEADRARNRRARELRWNAIRDGRVTPYHVDEVMAMWSDKSDPYVPTRATNGWGGNRRRRAAKLEADGLDRLLQAVTATAEPMTA